MTPEHRAAIRAGANLAAMPDDVLAELEQEKAAAALRHKAVTQHATRIFAIRRDRVRAERELKQLGELQPSVRARLNKLIAGSGQ